MCGIAGFQGGIDEPVLLQMTAALAPRGPDGEGTAMFDRGGPTRAGFGHRRLSIIDLSVAGHQPMTVDCPRCGAHSLNDLALTYNGELYNFPVLRAELESRGHRFHSKTDSEVLLHLWADEGPAMLPRLNGIFAFAIRDARPTGRAAGSVPGDVVVVRDPLGVKPLYVAELHGAVAFASEIKALLRVPGLDRSLDAVAIHRMLAHLWTPAPATACRGVRKLQAGDAIRLRGGAIVERWHYAPAGYDGTRDQRSFDDAAVMLRQEIAAAVDRQMISDVPVGAFLSGGLDSSAIVAAMRLARPDRPVPAFCISAATAAEGFVEDLPYAQRVAAHTGATLETVTAGPEIAAGLAQMVWTLDEPQADPAPLHVGVIAARARAAGIPVLMSGAGGDDILGGYRRHVALRLEKFWRWWPAPLRQSLAGAARGAAEGRGGASQRTPALRRAVKGLTYLDLDGDRGLSSYFWWTTEGVRTALYTPSFADAVGDADVATPMLEALSAIPREGDRLNRLLQLDTQFFLADHNLNYTDKMAMAAGVEVRVPLLDLEVVRAAARFDTEHKVRGMMTKAVFKRAMEPWLPHDVIYRPKTGFGAPVREWLRGPWRGLMEDVLSERSLRERGLFEPAAVARLAAQDRAGQVDGAYLLLALIVVELWCRQFIDGDEP
jgi:asparagine synthase (glutamine-hydrolysing)